MAFGRSVRRVRAIVPLRGQDVVPDSPSAESSPVSKESVLLGIAFMVGSTLMFAVLAALVRMLSSRYSPLEIAFFRNLFALFPVLAMTAGPRMVQTLKIRRAGKHFVRAALGVTAMIFGFLSYQMMPLADAVSISFMAPVIVTILSAPLLGEKVGPFRWGAVVVGFGGVLIIVPPGMGLLEPGALFAIFAALASALVYISIRQLSLVDHPAAIVFYFTLFSTILSALLLPFIWVAPKVEDWGYLALLGLCGGVGQYFMTRAFSLAPAVVVTPFNYGTLLWATTLGWLFWGEIPANNVLIGAGVVVASGLFILYRETRKAA